MTPSKETLANMTTKCKYTLGSTDKIETRDINGEMSDWNCPHEAHPKREYCIFHLTPNERSQLGVTPGTLRETIREVAERQGKEQKQLFGAKFEDLTLRRETFDTRDNYPLDLRHITVTGTLDMSASKVQQPIVFRNADINVFKCQDAEFDAEVDLSEATIGKCQGRETTFRDDVDFSGVHFEGFTDFREVRFYSDAIFRKAEFDGRALFNGGEFHGDSNLSDDDACFEEVRFDREVSFTRGLFRSADFQNCEFEGPADFERVTFTGNANFFETLFSDDVSFCKGNFAGGGNRNRTVASFENVQFTGQTTFEQVAFSRADFTRALFEGETSFSSAMFSRTAVFVETSFRAQLQFTEARFQDDAYFSQTSFASDVRFTGTEFHGGDNTTAEDTSFKEAIFHGCADFQKTKFRRAVFTNSQYQSATFSSAVFTGQVEFDSTEFKDSVVFDHAVFEEKSRFDNTEFQSVNFDEARFSDDVSFRGVTIHDDAMFRGVEFRGGDNIINKDMIFSRSTVEGVANFYSAEFGLADFSGVQFEDHVVFDEGVFTEEADFEKVIFGGKGQFSNVDFQRKASFSQAVFDEEAIFKLSRFRGDSIFESCTFHSEVAFQKVQFQGSGDNQDPMVAFDDSTFAATVIFEQTEFSSVSFRDVSFESDTKFNAAKFFHESEFTDASFQATCTFNEATFKNDAKFTGGTFAATASFSGVEFEGGRYERKAVSFEGTDFQDDCDFSEVEVEDATFEDAQFNGEASFRETIFFDDGTFTGANFKKQVHFDEATFEHDVQFKQASFAAPASFSGVEFEGGRYERGAVIFNSAVFQDDVNFTEVTFESGEFLSCRFCGEANFNSAVFNDVRFRPASDGEITVIDLTDAVIFGGSFGQPEHADIYYDCTSGEIHNVSIDKKHCERRIFDHFRFYETEFKGFSMFDEHRDYLARNNWEVHTFGTSIDTPDLRAKSDMTAANIENTYLKVKNSAKSFGDPKATSEFFIKEMNYRRLKNWGFVVNSNRYSDISYTNRVKALGKCVGNFVLYQTCGYGERIWRVVYVSLIAILFWGLLYATVTQGTTGQTGLSNQGLESVPQIFTADGLLILTRNMYFSMVTFTTLGYGDIQPVGTTARTLAGLEAFTGGLLIALVVFVLGRRVSK